MGGLQVGCASCLIAENKLQSFVYDIAFSTAGGFFVYILIINHKINNLYGETHLFVPSPHGRARDGLYP